MTESREVVWRAIGVGPLTCPGLHTIGAWGSIVDGSGKSNPDQGSHGTESGQREDTETDKRLSSHEYDGLSDVNWDEGQGLPLGRM